MKDTLDCGFREHSLSRVYVNQIKKKNAPSVFSQ